VVEHGHPVFASTMMLTSTATSPKRDAAGHQDLPTVRVARGDLAGDRQRLKLGGEERVLSVLFTDLAGFTRYSENYTPAQIMGVLSEYYDRMTELVFASRGMIATYVGDELMAIFGAPVAQRDHAKLACAAALAMRDARHVLALEWAKLGRPPLSARTGINSGPMLVGNYGSKYRFNYSVLGDSVNLASRLEQLNKVYRTDHDRRANC
jgi:adenylate cyclase